MAVKVVVHQEANPEDNAMLQALYSRSADSVTTHLEKLKDVGSGKFMSQYYLGYGHSSIADCGSTTVYIEGLSMIAAKALQDNPLFNGQESSSRYIDWSEQPFYDPFGTPESNALLDKMRLFYTESKPALIEYLKGKYPIKDDEKPTVYEKAITARAFDILRGFLPCGATTNTSWYMTLRKANEMLAYLSQHPLKEVRDVAKQMHIYVRAAHPNSIGELPKTCDYLSDPRHYYSDPTRHMEPFFNVAPYSALQVDITDLEPDVIFSDTDFYNQRPKYAPLPKHDELLQKNSLISTRLDFGSYRDLQRHRGGYGTVPMIENYHGFHPWYIDQLPPDIRTNALKLLQDIDAFLRSTWVGGNRSFETKLNLQYIMPMGTLVSVGLTYNVHQMLYVAELRSGQTVHSTLRPIAQEMGHFIEEQYSINTYCDFQPDTWTTRRGVQDITSKLV